MLPAQLQGVVQPASSLNRFDGLSLAAASPLTQLQRTATPLRVALLLYCLRGSVQQHTALSSLGPAFFTRSSSGTARVAELLPRMGAA